MTKTTFPEYRSGQISWLEGIKVGDKFMITNRYDHFQTLVECTKVTPKQAEVGGFKYRIADARPLGSDTWSSIPYLYNATPERVKKATDAKRHKEIVVFLNGCKFSERSLEQLEAVYAILDKEGKN